MLKRGIIKFTVILLVLSMMAAFVGCAQEPEQTDSKDDVSSGQNEQQKEDGSEPEQKAEDKKDSAGESQLDKIKSAGKIVLGTSADYPPYEFIIQEDGKEKYVGFDIEIAKEIAKDLGVELEVRNMDFDGLLMAMNEGLVDFVLAGMTPKEDRKKHADFSKIYYRAVHTAIVRAEDKDKYKSLEDLKGKKVGAQRGAIQEDIARNQIENAEVLALGKVSDLVLALQNDTVEAVIMELPVAKSYANVNKDLAVTEIRVEDEEGGSAVATRKGSTELLESINKTLDRLMESGKIDELVAEANKLADSLNQE